MQVNSISNSYSTAFKASAQEEMFARLNDNDLKNIAWAKASKDVNDKKHHKLDKALYYSLPLAAGISAATTKYAPEYVKMVGKNNLRALRLGSFGVAAASWIAGLTAINLVWNAKDYIAKTSSKAKEFISNNPILTTAATFAAGIGAIVAVDKLGIKGISKIINLVEKKGLTGKVVEGAKFVRDALNSSKVINKAAEYVAKVPAPIKEIARTTAGFAPLIIIGSQIAHSFGHQNAKVQQASNNYKELKAAQENIRQDVVEEEIDNQIEKMSIKDLHEKYEEMLMQPKPIINAQTKEPISFEEFVKLATTRV